MFARNLLTLIAGISLSTSSLALDISKLTKGSQMPQADYPIVGKPFGILNRHGKVVGVAIATDTDGDGNPDATYAYTFCSQFTGDEPIGIFVYRTKTLLLDKNMDTVIDDVRYNAGNIDVSQFIPACPKSYEA